MVTVDRREELPVDIRFSVEAEQLSRRLNNLAKSEQNKKRRLNLSALAVFMHSKGIDGFKEASKQLWRVNVVDEEKKPWTEPHQEVRALAMELSQEFTGISDLFHANVAVGGEGESDSVITISVHQPPVG